MNLSRVKQKLKSGAAFTLTEMLVCLIVVALTGSVLVTGFKIGGDTYNQSVFISESEMVSNLINTTLSDIIPYARDINETGGIIYMTTDSMTNCNFIKEDDCLKLVESGSEPQNLITESSYGTIMLTDFSVSYVDKIMKFNYKLTSKKNIGLSKSYEASFRVLN